MNKLYYGDNLEVLRDAGAFPDGFADLIYLDPPFNSNAGYNVLFKDQSGGGADASMQAFGDTWTWGDASRNMVRDLGRVMERDKHRFGLFVMKGMPTKGMRDEAASQPLVETPWGRFPRSSS